jgi:hypothetical protein
MALVEIRGFRCYHFALSFHTLRLYAHVDAQVSCNNPAPVVLPDSDTIYVMCHGGPDGNHWGLSVGMVQAPTWRGPWTNFNRNDTTATDVDL